MRSYWRVRNANGIWRSRLWRRGNDGNRRSGKCGGRRRNMRMNGCRRSSYRNRRGRNTRRRIARNWRLSGLMSSRYCWINHTSRRMGMLIGDYSSHCHLVWDHWNLIRLCTSNWPSRRMWMKWGRRRKWRNCMHTRDSHRRHIGMLQCLLDMYSVGCPSLYGMLRNTIISYHQCWRQRRIQAAIRPHLRRRRRDSHSIIGFVRYAM